jgi:DNA-binding MarR family transcriptional regulator
MEKKPNPVMPVEDLDIQGAGDAPYPLPCTNTALRRAARRLGNLYDEALAPLNLKATQVGLLAELDKFRSGGGQEGPTLQDLGERLAIQISAVTHALRPLVRDGLIEVRPDALDRRTKRSVMTPLGKARFKEALVLWDKTNRRVETVLGPTSAKALRTLADEVASEEFLHLYKSRA